jgi:hypothetical protein
MKKYLLSALLFIGNYAVAQMIEVSESEKIVYFAPTPVLNVHLLSLQKDGGVLTLTLNYDGPESRNQDRELQAQFPGYALKALVVQITDPQLMIRIPEIELNQLTILQQAQMGPLLSAQFSLSVDQVARLKAKMGKQDGGIHVEIPVRAALRSPQILESYEISERDCAQLRVKTVADLMDGLTRLKRPLQIHFDSSFESYKKALLDNCFEISTPGSIQSFKDLMATELRAKPVPVNLPITYSENRLHDVNLMLVPKVHYEIY